MSKKLILIITLLSILLTACSNMTSFEGGSSNWDVNYEVKITGKNEKSTFIRIEYVGGGFIPQTIDYIIEDGSGKVDGNSGLDKGVLEIKGYSCKGCSVQETKDINATIKWNGMSETIELK